MKNKILGWACIIVAFLGTWLLIAAASNWLAGLIATLFIFFTQFLFDKMVNQTQLR